jgi:hypothetical protein
MKILIRAVPNQRVECVEYLKTNIPNAEIFYDTKRNAMTTFLEALEYVGSEECVHMEEDIFITNNFMDKLLTEISKRPNEIIQFFSMRKADLTIGSRYDNNFCMNQCFYLPSGYSKNILHYYDKWNGKIKNPTAYDYLINDFLKERKEKYWISVPSLVEHRIEKSLINPKRSSKRQSLTFTDKIGT